MDEFIRGGFKRAEQSRSACFQPRPQQLMKFTCSSCGQHIEADAAYAGIQINCPTCGKLVQIPAPAVATPPHKPALSVRHRDTEPANTESPPVAEIPPPAAFTPAATKLRPASGSGRRMLVVCGWLGLLGVGAACYFVFATGHHDSAIANIPVDATPEEVARVYMTARMQANVAEADALMTDKAREALQAARKRTGSPGRDALLSLTGSRTFEIASSGTDDAGRTYVVVKMHLETPGTTAKRPMLTVMLMRQESNRWRIYGFAMNANEGSNSVAVDSETGERSRFTLPKAGSNGR
ncbi:MAG: hypothetical protein AB1705_10650 [Verrucomicrobiota bacterium]